MHRRHVKLYSPAIERSLDLLALGHGGRPVLVFPSSEGAFHEYEDYQMVQSVAPWLESGRLRLYCVSSHDAESWYGRHRPLHERAWQHHLYDDWIMNQVVPAIGEDVGDPQVRLTATGCSFGAYHAANFALKHPQRFGLAICMSGVYDMRFLMHGHQDDWVYFNNPMEYVHHLEGPELERVQRQTFIQLVCGQGPWEGPALDSTRAFRDLLGEKHIPNHMDLWGHDVSHDWHWWREQIKLYANHLAEESGPWRSS